MQAAGPVWAQGCDKCQAGLINAPDASPFAAPIYLVRLFQAKHNRLVICDCRAGNMYRQFLRNAYRRIESGEDILPDMFRQAIEEEVTRPTIRYERVPA